MDKITVVTVCYNSEKTIRNTIVSVLRQTYNNIEYVFIDGDSTDSTNNIIEEYRHDFEAKGIDYIHISERDNGIYDAMNKGIIYSSGDWINFLNSDDQYVDENVLQTIVDNMDDKNDCIYGDTINVLKGESFYRKSFEIDVLTYRNPYVHQALFCRKDIIRNYKFNTIYTYAADFDQAVRLYNDKKSFKHVSVPVCKFSLEGRSQKNNNVAVREFETIRRKNGIAKKDWFKRYLLYIAVVIVKGNGTLYKLYVALKKG
ncbi:MAG: glycosyltransferase [Clostridiales bacterium]|nr:glycosyltransferase [Clostridiales bacterium]